VRSACADDPKSARDFYERGLVHERNKRFEAALADFSKAIELDPKFTEAYFSRSAIYAGHPKPGMRDYSKAIADLTKLLDIEPKGFSARFNRGLYYEYIEEYDNSIADYTKLIEGDTDFSRCGDGKDMSLARAHHYRGRTYLWHKKDYAKAVADFDAALRLDLEIEMVHYYRGQANQVLKEYRKARDDYAIALDRDPDYPQFLKNAAWLLATCPNPKYRNGRRAVELAGKACGNPGGKGPEYLDTLAAAYAEIGAFDDAVQMQKKAIETPGPIAPDKRIAMQERLRLYEMGKPYHSD